MITFAKGVTSGYIPLGGVVASDEIAAPYWAEPGGPTFRHGATYAGHPVACAAALAVLDIYEDEDLIPRGRELEQPLYDALAQFASHPAVAEVRGGCGFLAAIGARSRTPTRAPPPARRRRARGRRARPAAARRHRGVAAADLRPVAPRPARGGRRVRARTRVALRCNPYRGGRDKLGRPNASRAPIEEREEFPTGGFRARRWLRFERDLQAWLDTPEGRFAAWDATQAVGDAE